MSKAPPFASMTLRRLVRLLRLYYGLSAQADDRSRYHLLYYGAYCEMLRRNLNPERITKRIRI